MMSPELETILRAAGWNPDRSVSISKWIETLRSHGFSVVPEAEVILRGFGGLKVEPARTPADKYAPGVVIFNPLLAAELDRVTDWQEYLGMVLTPIGEVAGQACLLIAEDGSVYTSWDRFLWKNGASLSDSLENTLVFGRQRPVEVFRGESK